MVIDDLHVIGVAIAPDKADAPWVIDANAVLTFSFALKGFQMVAGRGSKVAKLRSNLKLPQLPLCDSFEALEPSNPSPLIELFRLSRPEGLDHPTSIYC